MKASKLVKWLLKLDTEEVLQFHSFLEIPPNRLPADAIKLLDYLLQKDASATEADWQRENVFKAIFPQSPYNYHRLANLMSLLKKALLHFFAYLELQKDTILQKQLQARFFKKRNWHEAFNDQHKKLLKQLNKAPQHDFDYHWNCWHSYRELFFYPFTLREDTDIEIFDDLTYHADSCLLLGKLKYGCEGLSRKQILNVEHKSLLLDEVIQTINQSEEWSEQPIMQLSIQLIKLHQNPAVDQRFQEIKTRFWKEVEVFSHEDQLFILHNLINYAVGRHRAGERSYLSESFHLYREGFEKGILPTNGILTDTTFMNINIMSCIIGDFDYANYAIKNFSQYLHPESRDNMCSLAKAYIAFHQRQYTDIQKILNDFSGQSPNRVFQAKTLELRSSYLSFLENSRNERYFLSFSRSFEQYARSNRKVGPEKKIGYLNLIKLLRRLGRLYSHGQSKGLPGLIKDIEERNPIVAKDWLLKEAKRMREQLEESNKI